MSVCIGLDLGTCFSSVFFRHGDRYMALSPDGEHNQSGMIPSVFFADSARSCAGTPALKAGRTHPEGLSRHIKRRYRDKSVELSGKSFAPAEIVAEIIRYILEGARHSLKEHYHITDAQISAVVTIPVTYGEQWKLMLTDAVRAAGCEVKAVLPEPVAAAVCFYESAQIPREQLPERVLVYDLGGGTTDISLLRYRYDAADPHSYEVVAQDGDDIGGNDWDDALCDLLDRQLCLQLAAGGADTAAQMRFLTQHHAQILQAAREIKEALTETEQYSLPLEIRGDTFDLTVTRAEFEEATRDLLERTVSAVKKVISKAEDFDEMILVGGGSRMPQVKRRLSALFPDRKISLRNPEFSVAIGAACVAQDPDPQKPAVSVQQRAAHSYGILYMQAESSRIRNLIFKGDRLPAEGSLEWTLPGQCVQFLVYEGVHESGGADDLPLTAEQYAVSATAWLRKPPPAGTSCQTRMSLDNSGRLRLTVFGTDGEKLGEASLGTCTDAGNR